MAELEATVKGKCRVHLATHGLPVVASLWKVGDERAGLRAPTQNVESLPDDSGGHHLE